METEGAFPAPQRVSAGSPGLVDLISCPNSHANDSQRPAAGMAAAPLQRAR